MDVDGPGAISSPGTEEETIARKRARRVSFADTTAVHVFDRDEDFETPPEDSSAFPSSSPSPGRSSAEADDGNDTSDAGSPAPRIIFMPDIDSSSPGSAAGSVVSADDDNFFGPVSTSFIQIGRPSDAGMSEDDNHDITLDSRTFSRHFLNVAPPEECTANSVGSLRTPDTTSKGDLEELNVSEPGGKLSSGRDALTDMSMLTGDPRTYDYGKLSPLLNDIMQKIGQHQPRRSPTAGTADVNPDRVAVLTATEEEQREETSHIHNGISPNEMGADSSTEKNPVSTSSDISQEDGFEKSQETSSHDQVAVDSGINNTVEPSVTSNFDLQHHHPFHESSSKKQPSDSIGATHASTMSNVELECYPLDQPSSRAELPKAYNIRNASKLSTADPVIWQKDAEQLHQQNEVMDTETILCTPRTVVQQFVPQDSILFLRSQGEKLFTPLSNCKVGCPEASSLSVEFVKHDQRISALESLLKLGLQESASRLPLIGGNELGFQANDIFKNAEDQATCNSVPRRQMKKIGESFTQGTLLGQGPNESANVQSTSCDVLTLHSQLSHKCNSHLDLDGEGRNRSVKDNGHAVHEWPEEISEASRSPNRLRRQLTSASEFSVPLKVFKEKENGGNNSGQSVNVDWNKAVCAISNATEQILAASISKLNLQQLNILGDKLDGFQMARKYRRLSNAVRVEGCCGDHQKRLAEVRSLHERLLYEKAKLQIKNMKLTDLRNKSQQCQIESQECSLLKCKTLDAAQVNNGSLHDASMICSSDGQEPLAAISKKRLEYNLIQQKVESLRSSLEYFRNNEVEISCQGVMKFAEEQSDIRNQYRVIHQQIGLPVLSDIVKRDNKRDVILNYRNLLFQRIVLNIRDTSSIFVSNSLNGTKIRQTFPDLDASVAFSYIFKAEENQSVSDFQLLPKKTMETNLLLGNLVDVLDEIKFAKMKLLNLISAAFILESQTCQLVLRLCFMSFKNGKRIDFTIDMTDLKCSVYPSEPSELVIKLCQAQTTLPQTIIEEVMVSIRNLEPGRTVIIRLCRMVSQLIQSLPC